MLHGASAPLELRDCASSARHATAVYRAEPLKICFIAETFHAGVGRHIADVTAELSRRGHEIHLLYSPIRYEQQFLERLTGLPSVFCTPIAMPRAIGTADLTAFAAILKYVRSHGPFDVVHGHSSKGGGYARLLKLLGARAVLYSPHAFVTLSPAVSPAKKAVYRTLERILARLTNNLICTSQMEMDHALELGIGRQRLALIPNGGSPYDAPPRASLRTQLGLSVSDIVVGFAGRMEDQKAPERLVAAARKLLPHMPRLKFLMIGDGPKRAALLAAMEHEGLGSHMIWPGAANARGLMPAMDMFVLPSCYEGFAYVLIEALYAGLPIIATPVGGTQESIIPDVNGMIVPHADADAMAQAIRQLANDPVRRAEMGAASHARAEFFSVPRMVDGIEEMYLRLRSMRSLVSSDAPVAEPA